MVCELKMSLYGLKQAGKIWNTVVTATIVKVDYTRLSSDQCLFFKKPDKLVAVFVDDFLGVGDNSELILELKKSFEVKELGALKHYLNVHYECVE